ncbi:MAG: DUF499 domain-containing protein [Candidatus Nezhaarchaeales archaeon]
MLTGSNRIRSDVLDEALDEKMAPSLGGVVLGREHEMYVDPGQFFQRTLITKQMMNILVNLVSVLKEGSGKRILILTALYGGGKTHTLLTIYHALKAPHMILKAKMEDEDVREHVNKLVEEMGKLGRPDLIVIDGYFSELAPSPISPLDAKAYKVRSLWGYVAHTLGNYSVVKEYDERLVAPEADKLLKLFENRSVVILIDELAHYIKRLYETPDESLRRYTFAIESFMEVLAPAIELSRKVILVIALPVEKKKDEVIVEITYQAIKQTLGNIFRALNRVFTECIEPIAPEDVSTLLRTRLFEEIDARRARDVKDLLNKAYVENKEVFGENVRDVEKISRTYPFHPLYVSTLLDILDKHEGLQRTRDLLRISRKVLREVLRDERSYDVIMPWHIDLTKTPIRNALLIGDYESFKPIIEEDVNERVKLFGEKHALARITALALLAKTFVYGGGLAPKMEVMPQEKDLAQMVYEPALFQLENWAPKDIIDAIKWISENLAYVVKDERTGRLWFTRWITPIKYVEERARKIEDLSAISKVLECAGKLLRETADSLIRKKSLKAPQPKVFDAELSRAYRACEPIDVDSRKYVLLAFLDVPERQEERRAKLEEVAYRTKSGGTRRYANTIYVTFPSSRERVNLALEWAKKVIACEEVEKEGIVEKATGRLPSEEAEIAKEVLKKKLEDYKARALQNLVSSILNAFDKVAYPHYDENKLANTIKEDDLVSKADSIIMAVEKSLASTGIGKVKTEMDFDTLDFYLRRINIDISEGTEARSVKEIINFFYSNPRLPAVPREAIQDAMKDGVRRLKIGVRSRGKVFFKKVYEKTAPQISEGETIPMLDEEDEVLPWRMALEEQMKVLKRREYGEGRERRVEEYVVLIAGREVSTEEVLRNLNKFDLEILRTAPIIKIIKAVSIKVELAKPIIEVRPGEQVSVDAQITRIGPYIGEVVLRPSIGKVDKVKLTIDGAFTLERFTWIIGKAPSVPGDYVYTLEVVDSSGSVLDVANVTVRVLGEEAGWREGIPPNGSRLEGMELAYEGVLTSIKPLDILKKRVGGTTIVSNAAFELSIGVEEGRKSSILLKVQNVKVDDFLELTLAMLNRFGLLKSTASLSVSLKPLRERYFIMPELTEEEMKSLGEYKVRYLLHQSG